MIPSQQTSFRHSWNGWPAALHKRYAQLGAQSLSLGKVCIMFGWQGPLLVFCQHVVCRSFCLGELLSGLNKVLSAYVTSVTWYVEFFVFLEGGVVDMGR